MPNPGECNLTESRQTARSPLGKTIIHTKVGRTTRTWAMLEMGMGGPELAPALPLTGWQKSPYASPLMPRRELRPERDAVCPKPHTPNHKGTSECLPYSLWLGPPCSPAFSWVLSRPRFSKPPGKAANGLTD